MPCTATMLFILADDSRLMEARGLTLQPGHRLDRVRSALRKDPLKRRSGLEERNGERQGDGMRKGIEKPSEQEAQPDVKHTQAYS